MSWLYSRELVEEYSEAKCLDGEQCALWNGTHTQPASWLPAKTTKHCHLSRSGMTFKPLTDDLGEAVFQSCLEAFPVRTFPVQEKEPALTESEAVCGDTWQESSVKFDLNTSSWRTHRSLWEEDLPESSVTLPKWGMMRDGVLWERTMLPPLTSGTGSGLSHEWRTPMACDWKNMSSSQKIYLQDQVKMWPTPTQRDYKGTNAPEGLTRKDGKSRMDQLPNAVAYATPQARDYRTGQRKRYDMTKRKSGAAASNNLNDQIGGQLNPTWVEWLMGWPIGWTDSNALEMDKFLTWPHSHGDY